LKAVFLDIPSKMQVKIGLVFKQQQLSIIA